MMPQLLCDDQDLKRFLEGDLSPAEESTWLEHIESCRECQTRLEGLAASRDWWSQAKSFLTESDPTGPGLPGDGPMARQMPFSAASGGALPVDDPEESAPEPVSLEFLGPTDDPESLGRIGIYEVTGVIGRGGSGIVFKAFDPTLDRNVAIKVLSPHLAASGAARKRFAREAQAAAAVVHEHVIPIFAVASHQNLPYIVMQYFPGKSLQQRLDRDGPLELKEILRIGLQTARGLAAAHAQGLIHRDVKPANILLGDGIERVSLSDFGLARALDDARLTRTGWLAGTPEYMSPEQAKGQALDARSDLFSLGSVLYALCTGRVPFHAETSYGTLRQVTDEEPTPIRQINPDIPEWLCRLIGQLMAKTPVERLGSASEVADLLETCLAHVQQPDSTSLPAALQPKPQTAPSSHSGGKRTLVATLLGFLGFLLAGVFLWQSTSPPDIAGWWTGEDWGKVQLKHLGSGEYEGTYSDTFGKDPGQIQLKWSRIERRFNGTWREGEDRFGELSLRLVKEEIRGALTTDARSKINPATPRLADLVWVKGESPRSEPPGEDFNGKGHELAEKSQTPSGAKPSLEANQSTLSKSPSKENPSLVSQILGEWQPQIYCNGFSQLRYFQNGTPSPVWKINDGEIVFQTTPPIKAKFEIMEENPSLLLKLTYPNMANQYFRIQTEGDRLQISSRKDGPPREVLPSQEGEFWHLARIRPGSPKQEQLVVFEKPEKEVESKPLVYPPGKDQLFPLEPIPKNHCPNLLVEIEENGTKKSLIAPLERNYSKQVWSAGNDEKNSIVIKWSYKGRKVKNPGPDDEFYDFSIQSRESDEKTITKDFPVTYTQKKIMLTKTNKFTVTIEPASVDPFPQITVQADKVLGIMLANLRTIKEGQIEILGNITNTPSIVLFKNNLVKRNIYNQNSIIIYDLSKRLKLMTRIKYYNYYEITFIDYLTSNLFPNLMFEHYLDDLCEWIRDESGPDGDFYVYKILPRYSTTAKPSDRLIWVDKKTYLPYKMESYINQFNSNTFNHESPIKLETFQQLRKINSLKFQWNKNVDNAEFDMSPSKGVNVQGLEIYLKSLKQSSSQNSPDIDPVSLLSQFQGEWVPHRVIGEDGAELAREKITSRVWTIKGTNLIVEGEEIRTFPLTVVETGLPVRIEFTAPVSLPTQARKPSLKTTEISSLWERRTTPEGERLIIVVGQDGKKPTQAKPTPGFVFYELRRLEKPSDGPPPAIPAAKDEVAENPILKNLPHLNQLFRNERRETSHPPKAVTPTDKAELFKYLQGNWVIEKQILLNAKGTKTEEKGGDVWNIEGTNLTTWARPDIRTPLEILSLEPQIRIDFVVSGALRESLGANPYGSFKIPTLWEIGGEKLKVVLAQRGVLPQKAEPTPDCIYFELARKPRSETTRLGFPARFQGKWKVSRMVGPDQKDGQLNLGETVTIEPGLLRIGDQIKKAELVDTGSLLKGNLVSTVISPKDGSINEVRIVSLWELTENKIRFVNGVEIPTKVEPGIGCFYYELERIENEKPNGNSPNLKRTPSTETPMVEVRKEKPGSEGTNLVFYRKKTDDVDRFVQNLPRHPFGFDQPRKTEEVVVPGARFTVTWKWGNRLPLVPGPDAELLDVQILKSGDPVSKTLTKQVYLVGHSVTLHEDDNFKLVLEPTSGSLSATKKVSETPELIAMLEKIKTNDSVCWENQGVGLFREADLIFCCQKKGLLRCDEYRDQKWLRSQVLNFPQSKILSVDSDPSVPRGEGTLDATSLHLQNLFVQFADMASDRAILLGQETVEGKPCNLYRIQSDAPYQKTYQDRYLWVDQATHLPTAIRFAAKEAPAVFTYRQFLWSLPLGDDHFHLETTKEKRPAPPGKPKTEVDSPTSKTETKDPQSTPKAPDKKTSTKP